jgi:hypothetical protein
MVNSFSKEQDRSIGDVLKRMPGIEVLLMVKFYIKVKQ